MAARRASLRRYVKYEPKINASLHFVVVQMQMAAVFGI